MAEHDFVIDNDSASAARADINSALLAIVSNNSKATEPTVMFAWMWWNDTTTNILKMRNSANSAWINIGTLDNSLNIFTVANLPATDTSIVAPSVIVEGYNDTTGTLTATTWTDCHFSSLVQNTISASLASHRVTLPAGTYYIDNFVKMEPGSGGVVRISLRLYDHTNTAIIAEYVINQGQLDHSAGSFCGANVFTLSAPAAIALQVYKNSGDGGAKNALVKIWKTA